MRHNVGKVIAINFCTRFHFYIHVYALLLQNRGLDLLQINAIESVVIATKFVMEVPTGVVADRIGRKWSLTLSVGLMMCAEVLFLFARSYPLYLLMAVLTGTGFAFASGATESLIHDSLSADGRDGALKRAMGQHGSVGQIAFFLSPVIGGLLVSDLRQANFDLAIVLTAGMLLIGVLISLTLKEPPSAWHTQAQSPFAILRSGLGEIRHNRSLRRSMLLAMFTAAFTGTLVTTFAAPHLTQTGVPPLWIGLALSLGSLGAAFTQRYAHRLEQRLGFGRAMILLTMLPGISYLGLAVVGTIIGSGGAVLSWLLVTWMYATNDMRAPLLSAHQNMLITTSSRATALSLVNMSVSLTLAVLAPLYAAIGTRSLPLAFAVMGSVIVLGGLVFRLNAQHAQPATNGAA